MPKIKSDEKPTVESEQPSQDELHLPASAKEGRPVKIARAPITGSGTAELAKQSEAMQEAVGNQRAGQMMAAVGTKKGPGRTSATAIQRQPKTPNPAPPISTPLPAGTQRNRQGAATLHAGGVPVTVLPDTTSRARSMRNRAETRVRLHWGTPSYRQRGGVVQSVGAVPQPTVSIRTTYGPGVTSGSTSAYGRGTTRADIAAGQTSLGHHEGSHGTDFLDYLNTHPLPRFTGQTGMSVEEFQQAVQDYYAAMQQYQQDMEDASHRSTDCIGTPGENCGP